MPTVIHPARSVRYSLITLVTLLSIVSCAQFQTPSESPLANGKKDDAVGKELAANPAPKGEKPEKSEVETVAKTPTQSADDVENLTIGDVIRIEEPNTANLYDNSRYDFPITVNARVEGFIDYFTGRGRHHMERYLGRSSRYMPAMKEILRKNGLPEDLVFLALIESGFNMQARSRARAVGPWQFIKATGTRYGLRVDRWIDERRDWVRSTEDAAKYLKDLYLMFESWYLAASAYNAGENKILRAIESQQTHNFWRMCQTKALPRETKDYVPKLIAAAIIAKNPAKYGFADVAYQQPLDFDTVTVDFPVSLKTIAQLIDAPEDDLLDLNPELGHGVVPPDAGAMDLRVPAGTRVVVERALASLKNSGEQLAVMPLEYKMRAGETLKTVSRKYNLKVADLAAANNLSPKEKVKPGTELIIPNRSVSSSSKAASSPSPRTPTALKKTIIANNENPIFTTHVVKKGESLWSISEKFRVTIQELFRWNNLKHSKIYPGRKLRIKPDRESRSDETAVISTTTTPLARN